MRAVCKNRVKSIKDDPFWEAYFAWTLKSSSDSFTFLRQSFETFGGRNFKRLVKKSYQISFQERKSL